MARSSMLNINLNTSSDEMLSISLDATIVARLTQYPLENKEIEHLRRIGGVIKVPTTEWGALNMEPLPSKTIALLRLETALGEPKLPNAYWFSSGLIPGYKIWTRYWNVVGYNTETGLIQPRQEYQLYAIRL